MSSTEMPFLFPLLLKNIYIYLFERKKYIFTHLLTHSSNIHNDQSSLNPGARNATLISHVNGRDPNTWITTMATQGLHEQEAGVSSHSPESNPTNPLWHTGSLSGILTTKHPLYPQCFAVKVYPFFSHIFHEAITWTRSLPPVCSTDASSVSHL